MPDRFGPEVAIPPDGAVAPTDKLRHVLLTPSRLLSVAKPRKAYSQHDLHRLAAQCCREWQRLRHHIQV